MKRVTLIAILAAAAAVLPAVSALAQMRPGAKVEKTYGLGLPRDMDKLLIPDAEYPVYPLKPGQEAYADVDGYRIKENIKKITAFSLMSLDAGELYWGRIPGLQVPPDGAWTSWPSEYGKLGLDVRRQPVDLPPMWYPTALTASYAAGGKTGTLLTMFPIDGTKPTPAAGITAEAVWVGVGAAPDLLGRDVKGKAVVIYSTFVPGGRSHSASDRAGLFNADTLADQGGRRDDHQRDGGAGQRPVQSRRRAGGPDAVPHFTISQDEGFMLRDLLATARRCS